MPTRTKKIFSYLYCAIVMISACLLFRINTQLTNSGVLSFYGSEIIGVCVGCFVLFYMFSQWKKIRKEVRLFLIFTVIFSFYCFAVYLFRIASGNFELKSILVLESNILVIGFMFLILLKLIPTKTVLSSLSCFACIFGVLSVILYYFLDYDISNQVMLNHATRTYLLGILLPISVFQYLSSKSRASCVFLYVQLVSLIYCGLVSGSRINYTLIPFIVILSFIILARGKLFSVKYAIIALVVPIIMVLVSANFNIYIYSQLTRLPVTNTVLNQLHITYHSPYGDLEGLEDEDLSDMINSLQSDTLTEKEKEILRNRITVKSASVSTTQSSSLRFYAWEQSIKDIKKNPLFGIGLQQYSATSSDGELTVPIQSHNFVLEYILSFGILGFSLWALMITAPLFVAFKKIRFRIWNNIPGICLLSAILFACAGAFFQPYFIFPCIMTFIYTIIGCFYCLLQESNSSFPAHKEV